MTRPIRMPPFCGCPYPNVQMVPGGFPYCLLCGWYIDPEFIDEGCREHGRSNMVNQVEGCTCYWPVPPRNKP